MLLLHSLSDELRTELGKFCFSPELSASPSEETFCFLFHLLPVCCLSGWRKSAYLAGE